MRGEYINKERLVYNTGGVCMLDINERIECLSVSIKTYEVLRRANFNIIEDVKCHKETLNKIFDSVSKKEIEIAMHEAGYTDFKIP